MKRAQRGTGSKKAKNKTSKCSAPAPRASRKRSGLGKVDDGMLFVFSHPLRIRMIVSLNEEGDGSPSDLGKRLGVEGHHCRYHMKKLLEHDCVELVEEVPVGNLTKTIYRAKVKVDFPEEIWRILPPSVKKLLLAAVFLTSASDAQVALLSGSFEARPESHASWTPLRLDEQGWQLLCRRVDDLLTEAEQIQSDAKDRLAIGEQNPLNVSLNLSSFVLGDNIEPAAKRIAKEEVRKKLKGRSSLRHSDPGKMRHQD